MTEPSSPPIDCGPIRFAAADLPDYPAKFAGLPGAGHLHTAGAQLFNRLPWTPEPADHAAGDRPAERLEVPAGDGSGDRLAADLYLPADERPGRPLVVLLHGLGGYAGSPYVRACAADLLAAGLRVVAMNFRGCGRSRETCHGHFHPGRTGDVKALLDYLEADAGRDLYECGVIPVGFSLGGSILLKGLAAADPGQVGRVRAAVAVSAPLDLATCSRALGEPSNAVYQWDILRAMREHVTEAPGDVTDEELETMLSAGSVWEMDERFTAPHLGFASAEAFYREHSAGRRLGEIGVPTLLLVAADDPFVPLRTYEEFDWAAHPHLVRKIAETGGHSGFLSVDGPTYHARCVTALAERAAAA